MKYFYGTFLKNVLPPFDRHVNNRSAYEITIYFLPHFAWHINKYFMVHSVAHTMKLVYILGSEEQHDNVSAVKTTKILFIIHYLHDIILYLHDTPYFHSIHLYYVNINCHIIYIITTTSNIHP